MIEGFFGQKSYSRKALEGDNPIPINAMAIFALSGVGKTETLKALRKAMPDYVCASGGDFQRRENGAGTNDEVMKRAARAMLENPQMGTDKACEIFLLSHSPPAVLEARMAPVILTYGGRRPYRAKLQLHLRERARRRLPEILKKNRDATIESVEADLIERDLIDRTRLVTEYPDGYWNDEDFDDIVPTTLPVHKVVERLVTGFEKWKAEVLQPSLLTV